MSRTQQVIFTSLHLSKPKFWMYRKKRYKWTNQSVINLKTNDYHREQQRSLTQNIIFTNKIIMWSVSVKMCLCLTLGVNNCFVFVLFTEDEPEERRGGSNLVGVTHNHVSLWGFVNPFWLIFNSIQYKDEIFYVFFGNIHSEFWIWCLLSKNLGTFLGLGTDGTIF